MTPRFADLHLHTRYSDGTYTPEQLATEALRHELSALAFTDHDTVEGCVAMGDICAQAGLEFIPGTELTAEFFGHELHFLGYSLDIYHPPLLAALAKFQKVRQNRICQIVERLHGLHIPLNAEDVFALANCKCPGRPHVARALVEGGFCDTLEDAFDRYLKKYRPAWVPKCKVSAVEAIQLIHDAKGLAVLAHPGLQHQDEAIPILVEAGLDGLECFHTKHSPAVSQHYLSLARHYQLLVTGGSDCHGYSKGMPCMGGVKLPYEYFEVLKAKAMGLRVNNVKSVPAVTTTLS